MTAGVREEPRETVRSRTPRRLPLPTLLAVLVGFAAVGYRLALLFADVPPTNSDEATMGLAALHIARGDGFPVWFYGQAYMGTLEAYLAAPLIALAGPSVLVLRLPTLALYALFLLLSWRLTRRLGGDRWYALLVVAVLALGADRVVKNQLIAGGGYPELNPAGAALALLTVGLCVTGPGARLPRWAAWGLIAGVLLWVDPLILPYVLTLGALLVAWRWRELAGRAGVVLAGALLLGTAPMLVDSLRHGRNPVSAVLAAGGTGAAADWADRLHGGLVLGPPLAMGFCSPGRCATWQLWWAVAFPVLLLLAAFTAWHTLRRAGGGPRSAERVSAGVRLALLGGAAGVLAAYAVSNAAGRTPIESSRYLSCLAVAVPALLWPLWQAARPLAEVESIKATGRRAAWARARVAGVGAVAVLAGVLGTGAATTVEVIRAAPAVHAEADRHRSLVDTLGALGVRHVRGGYWTCNRLTYATGENVLCAVVEDDLRPGFDRLPAYRREVAADPDAAWVALAGSPLAARLDARLGPEPGALDVVTVAGWRIYLPRR
ncbi:MULTISPECIES: DUF423 domain-containing protein [Micromonospora]|uniref:DUF423 domain-containing protein n=1 Tax=Micromonospora TaxID=1873 RepID=UPI00068C5A1A|nr:MULTISPECIES: DUF423 domain-containing protein [unclassified Micromonospora]MCK1806391.1 DUF423 domain-containing protein [Micromonospora sp. R42106]MCK1831377.1 DUF423 domain-containing protein [Micromonospora sp. R42003]MCK1842924.1 DUF423 domain-containing protein [Micromonospora sp. R42004]MCM1019618.1 DUF423 domain-containing protein [Micromonospora sp. XM-20-01]